jgi:hypothetical protein
MSSFDDFDEWAPAYSAATGTLLVSPPPTGDQVNLTLYEHDMIVD